MRKLVIADYKDGKGINAESLVPLIEERIKSIFPDSYISVKFSTNLWQVIRIDFRLATEYPNHIPENDIARQTLYVEGWNRDGSPRAGLPQILTMSEHSGYFFVNAEPGKNLVYETIKVPFRKMTIDITTVHSLDKLLNYIEKWFASLRALLRQNVARLPHPEFNAEKI